MALAVGNHADIAIPNVLLEATNADTTYVLVSLPWDGVSVNDDGSHVLIKLWLPINDARVSIAQIAPANWPPLENDLWIVPGVTPPAFVVSNGAGALYFLTADTIRNEYATHTNTLPPTVESALAAYGNKLVLLHRGNT